MAEPQTTTEPTLEPCPWCPTLRRETYNTEGGIVGVIIHDIGCFFAAPERRQVLTPRGVEKWQARVSVPSIAPVVYGDQQRFDVKWRRPNTLEIMECHDLSAGLLAFRIRAAIRMSGSVELLSLTPKKDDTVSNHVFTCGNCSRQWTIDSVDLLECFFIGLCYWCIRQRGLSKDQIDHCLRSLAAPASTVAPQLSYYEQALTTKWEDTNARRHGLIEAKLVRPLSESEITELRELQWLAGLKRELGTGPMSVTVAHDERERFAKIAESLRPSGGRMWTDEQAACFEALTACAKAIRETDPSTTVAPQEQSEVQCADCLAWFNPAETHTCRQQVQRNRRNAK